MCKCTPTIRTPFCGRGDCVWPSDKKPEGARVATEQKITPATDEEIESRFFDAEGMDCEHVTLEMSQRFFRRVKARIDAYREKIAALEEQVKVGHAVIAEMDSKIDKRDEKIAALKSNSCVTCDWMPLKAENAKMREKVAALLEAEGRELQQLRESAKRLLKESGRG